MTWILYNDRRELLPDAADLRAISRSPKYAACSKSERHHHASLRKAARLILAAVHRGQRQITIPTKGWRDAR
jgi:hypothetical protein